MYKKFFTIIILLLFVSSACSILSDGPTAYTSKDGKVEFVFPSGWKVNKKNENFDLQVISKDMTDVTGVFIYNKQDLSNDSTIQTIIDYQVKNLKKNRKNFVALSEGKEYEVNGNSYMTILYSGESDGFSHIYRFTGISFYDSDIFALILQTTLFSEYPDLESEFKSITDSARLKSN